MVLIVADQQFIVPLRLVRISHCEIRRAVDLLDLEIPIELSDVVIVVIRQQKASFHSF